MTKISINHITKIEGHASLTVGIDNGKVTKCELGSVEGARFFEGLVLNKHYNDIQEITSKICGICSVAHTVVCLKAVENSIGVEISEKSELLRELMTIGERIRSHSTHLYLLALPDYLGFESGIAMASKHKSEVLMALDLVKLGNNIVSIIGGKEMHPFTSVVGGFTQVPDKKELTLLKNRLKKAKPGAVKTVEIFAGLKYPKFNRETEYLALKTEKGFPLHYGKIVSTDGIKSEELDYKDFITEYITEYSNSKFAVKDGKGYMVGPLARMNNAHDKLDDECQTLIKKHKLVFPNTNTYYNNVAQALELVHWINRAIQIISENEFEFEGLPQINPKAGRGVACIEAPRGLLIHDYTFDEKGYVRACNIIPPTTQNLRNMEDDIRELLPSLLKKYKKKESIVLDIEKLIRAYDPCFSCSTHFLDVKWEEK